MVDRTTPSALEIRCRIVARGLIFLPQNFAQLLLDSTVVLRHANSYLILIIIGWAQNLLDLLHSISLPIFDLQENASIQNSFSLSRLSCSLSSRSEIPEF